jgi:hypothetical protein
VLGAVFRGYGPGYSSGRGFFLVFRGSGLIKNAMDIIETFRILKTETINENVFLVLSFSNE